MLQQMRKARKRNAGSLVHVRAQDLQSPGRTASNGGRKIAPRRRVVKVLEIRVLEIRDLAAFEEIVRWPL
jgi:hypothetical protein